MFVLASLLLMPQGETDRAAAQLAEARKLSEGNGYSSIERLKTSSIYFRVMPIPAVFETTYFAGLRKAGMSEE
jgi:hypothetical protein